MGERHKDKGWQPCLLRPCHLFCQSHRNVLTRRTTSLMTYYFNIAEHDISVVFEDATPIDGSLIQSLEPFRVESTPKDLLLQLIVTNDLEPFSPEDTELIRDIDTGNGMTLVDILPSGGINFTSATCKASSVVCSIPTKTFRFVAANWKATIPCATSV